MAKSYTRRPTNGPWGSFYSCAFVTRTGFWRPHTKYQADPYAPPVYETQEEYNERMRPLLEEILTKSETIPVVLFTTDHEAYFEDLLKEYPEYITLACTTPTQHAGETHKVRLWVAQLHEYPKEEVAT